MKKKGFGAGKINGFGGKVELNESVDAAAVRELKEECGVVAHEVKKHAELTFIFPHKPEWNQVVHVFVAQKWSGVPVESDEMKPEWFDSSKLPYDIMWVDDPFWLPHVLDGKFVTGSFSFAESGEILEKSLNVK